MSRNLTELESILQQLLAEHRRLIALLDTQQKAMKTFDELFAELIERKRSRPPGSATVLALDAGIHAQGKKVVEEAAEVWMAAEHESPERTAEEVSQLLYRVQVLMLGAGIGLDDVYRHL